MCIAHHALSPWPYSTLLTQVLNNANVENKVFSTLRFKNWQFLKVPYSPQAFRLDR